MSLLKNWQTANLQEDQPLPADVVPDVEEPYYEIEKILWWRKVRINKKIIKQIFSTMERIPSGGSELGTGITVQSSRSAQRLPQGGQPRGGEGVSGEVTTPLRGE